MSCNLPRFEAVVQLLKDVRANSFLDLNCGYGNLVLKIARILCACKGYGIDINDKAVGVAESKEIKGVK